MSEARVNCRYCGKLLIEEKGELAHGCLDCHGLPFHYEIRELEIENKKLKKENEKLKKCVEYYAFETTEIIKVKAVKCLEEFEEE